MAKNSILDELAYDPSAGALTYKDIRYLLIRPETIVGFQKAIEEHNRTSARDAFFQGGYQGGYLSAKKYKEIHHFSGSELIEFMMNMGTEIGWGHFKLNEYDSEKQILSIVVEKSAFAEAYGRSTEGICHLIRGVLSGLATILFSRNCAASESCCLAKGDEHCLFNISAK